MYQEHRVPLYRLTWRTHRLLCHGMHRRVMEVHQSRTISSSRRVTPSLDGLQWSQLTRYKTHTTRDNFPLGGICSCVLVKYHCQGKESTCLRLAWYHKYCNRPNRHWLRTRGLARNDNIVYYCVIPYFQADLGPCVMDSHQFDARLHNIITYCRWLM